MEGLMKRIKKMINYQRPLTHEIMMNVEAQPLVGLEGNGGSRVDVDIRDTEAPTSTTQPHPSAGTTTEVLREKITATNEENEGKEIPVAAATSGKPDASAQTSTEPAFTLRYATLEETQKLVRSIDDEKYEARLKGSYNPPRFAKECFADEG